MERKLEREEETETRSWAGGWGVNIPT